MHKLVPAALFVLLSVSISSHVYAQAEIVEKRQQVMKNNSAAVKAIKAAVEAKDYPTIETKAKDIMGNAEKIPDLFPKGSNVGKTKATTAIWEKPYEFAKSAKNLSKAAGELAAAAKAKDDAAVTAKVKALGDPCGSCHKAFRAEKYPE